jgi:hypothetical protein
MKNEKKDLKVKKINLYKKQITRDFWILKDKSFYLRLQRNN